MVAAGESVTPSNAHFATTNLRIAAAFGTGADANDVVPTYAIYGSATTGPSASEQITFEQVIAGEQNGPPTFAVYTQMGRVIQNSDTNFVLATCSSDRPKIPSTRRGIATGDDGADGWIRLL
jgi:hypothetical protein